MAQFDIFRNLGRTRRMTPYFLQVQSSQFDASDRRIVVPLAVAGELPTDDPRFYLKLFVEDRAVQMDPLHLFSMHRDLLGPFVESAAHHASDITWALDRLFSQAYG